MARQNVEDGFLIHAADVDGAAAVDFEDNALDGLADAGRVRGGGRGLLDVLVDGEFVQAKHDISLRFRGSSNQRLLDVKKTLAAGQPVWWEDEKVFATHTMEK